jgi:hypothetical protein
MIAQPLDFNGFPVHTGNITFENDALETVTNFPHGEIYYAKVMFY